MVRGGRLLAGRRAGEGWAGSGAEQAPLLPRRRKARSMLRHYKGKRNGGMGRFGLVNRGAYG
jgi:hypothetical protein